MAGLGLGYTLRNLVIDLDFLPRTVDGELRTLGQPDNAGTKYSAKEDLKKLEVAQVQSKQNDKPVAQTKPQAKTQTQEKKDNRKWKKELEDLKKENETLRKKVNAKENKNIAKIFVKKADEKKEETAVAVIEKADEVKSDNDVVIDVETKDLDKTSKHHPVSFTISKEENEQFSEEEMKKLDTIVAPFLNGMSYRASQAIEPGLVDIHVKRDNGTESLIKLDPTGVLMGGDRPYIMGQMENDTFMISVDDNKGLVAELFKNPFKVITKEEVATVMSQYYFDNPAIYQYIDLQETGFLNTISKKDTEKLGNALSFICTKQEAMGSRFRFIEYNGPLDFTLISDQEVKSPLFRTAETNSGISGIKIWVKKNQVSFTIHGTDSTYYLY